MRIAALISILTAACFSPAHSSKANELQPIDACVDPAARSELAATGTLRLGFATVGPWATFSPATSQYHGIAIELGNALARQLNVPLRPIAVLNIPKLIEAGKAGEWDVAISVVNAERRAEFDQSPTIMLDEATFLVPVASSIRSIADADRPGTRIVVVRNNPTDMHLSRNIKNAELVRADNENASIEYVRAGRADVMALARWNVPRRLEALPGFRSLDENFAAQPVAFSMAKGKRNGLECLKLFASEMLSSGLMRAAVAKAGLVGITLP